MEEKDASELAQQHLKTERTPWTATASKLGGRRCWQVSFTGDGEDPVIVTIDDQSRQVLQVFEPLKMMGAPPSVRDIITGDPEY